MKELREKKDSNKQNEQSERSESERELKQQKERLIKELIEEGWLKTDSVIEAFRKVPREDFVPADLRKYSYVNEPLPIGHGQTISQPLTVVAMTEALNVKKWQIILEIGTGSGYQAAVLSILVGNKGKIVTIERIKELYEYARKNLKKYRNVEVVHGDGGKEYKGRFDRIIVTASAPSVPEPFVNQLKPDGKMVIPVGDVLWLIEKDSSGRVSRKNLGFYRFVPLLGEYGYKE